MNPHDDDIRSSSADIAAMKRDLADAAKTGEMVGKSLVSAFEAVAFKGKSVGDAFNSLALSLSQAAFKAAFQPLEQGVGSLFRNLIGGGGGGLLPFSSNAALQAGTPVPFSNNGGITHPAAFALDSFGPATTGRAMSAASTSASRDNTNGPPSNTAAPAIVVHIATPDVESFRRSETQVAAQLARAVSLGQRNL